MARHTGKSGKKGDRIPLTKREREIDAARNRLKGVLERYVRPLEPVFKPEEWDVNK